MNSAASLVTPVLLTWNEEVNIGRTLDALRWAARVVILDSGSTDQTETIARQYPNVSWCVRTFDSHGAQWHHAIHSTGIDTPYVLALDADMVLNPAFVAEMEREVLANQLPAGELRFRMILGRRALLGDIYPSQLRLFRIDKVDVSQRGHTQVFTAAGPCHRFRARVDHQDSKSCESWLQAQLRYSELEARRIRQSPSLNLKDRLRVWGLMPLIAGSLGYLTAGGPLAGAASWRYAIERATFESMLALRLRRAADDQDTVR